MGDKNGFPLSRNWTTTTPILQHFLGAKVMDTIAIYKSFYCGFCGNYFSPKYIYHGIFRHSFLYKKLKGDANEKFPEAPDIL